MNHSPTKRKTSTGLLRSPWLAILFTLLLIASLVPLAINFSHSATAQETTLSETTDNTTTAVEDATAVNDLQSDNTETQPSDQLPVDDATATQDPQDALAGEEPSFWDGIWQSIKDFFGFTEDTTDQDSTEPVIDENNNPVTPVAENWAKFEITKNIVVTNNRGGSDDAKSKELAEQLKKENKSFKFNWECTEPNMNKASASGSFALKTNETKDNGILLAAGTKCTVTEDKNSALVGGFDHSLSVKFSGKPGDIKTNDYQFEFTLKDNDTFKFAIQNEYAPIEEEEETGQFTLEKKVEGLKEKDKDKEFEFTWVCREDENTATKGETALKNGARITITHLPLDSTCQISEKAPEIDGYTHLVNWQTNDQDRLTPTDSVFVNPRKKEEDPLVVTAINTYVKEDNPVPPKPPVPGKGTFTLKKEVKGLDQKDKNKEFEFKWSCRSEEVKAPVKGSAKLKDGATFKVENLPLDSTCLLSETNATVTGFKHSLQWLTNGKEKVSQNGIVAIDPRKEDGTELVVTAVNSYTKDDKPAPTTTSSSPAPTTTTTSSSTIHPVPTTSATSSMTPTTSASSTSSAT
ncbi:DUF5979 domain-containing protein, partial [Corynebacterium kutscheri]|uniref:DUF5979 domain-containing protein n=1 Tax=Corynebacterium kutscheri TaxID=35755 RepID=UPI0037C10DB2